MMSDLRELYQEVILDHNKNPRNAREIDGANHVCNGQNPLCGDKLRVYLDVDGDVIQDIGFEGEGCAISTASASLMTESLKGKTIAEAETLFDRFHHLLTDEKVDGNLDLDALGKLVVFAGVREFPVRVKCATLAWHTMRGALHDNADDITTE